MQAPANRNSRGILFMCTAMFCFVVNDAFVKGVADHGIPVHQTMAVRGIFATLIFTVGLLVTGQLDNIVRLGHRLILLRGTVDALLALCFISALALMPLADLTAITMISPLLITMIAALFLGEQVGWRRWSAILVGCCGMLLVVQPSGQGIGLAGILGIVTAFGVASRDLITRYVPASIPSAIIALGTTISSMLMGFALTPFSSPWATMSILDIGMLIGSAAMLALGNLFVAFAFRNVDVSVISPFRYTSVVWATLLGYVAFGGIPGPLAFVGIGLIVASGLYSMHRERLRMRNRADVETAA